MENENIKKSGQDDQNKDAPIKPDPETLGKTDPQEDMKGPVSSLAQKGSKIMESKEDKEKATKRHDKEM